MEMGASQLALRMVGSHGPHRPAAPAHRPPRPTTNGAALTEAVEQLVASRRSSSTRRRRLTGPRTARPRAPPGAPVRPARPDRDRLPAADERSRRQRREPRHRDRRDLARPEGAGQGAQVPGDRAVAAEPQRRNAPGQAPDDVRPARIRRHRAGRRHHHVHLPRRVLQQGHRKEPGVAEIIIAKQRNGPVGTTKLAFLRQWTKFENLAPDYQGPGEY